MALRLNFKMISALYIFFSMVVVIVAFPIDSFPGDAGIKSILLGPTIFLLPVKWLPNSIYYYLMASVINMILIWASLSSDKKIYERLFLFLSLISWVLIGFLGLVFIGFAAV